MIFNLFKSNKYSDEEYVKGILQKNETIEELFYKDCRRYFLQNYRNVIDKGMMTKERMQNADDLFQETFVHLWTEIENKKILLWGNKLCRSNKGIVSPMTSNLHTFMMAIAKNKYREQLRKEIPEALTELDNTHTVGSEDGLMEQTADELKHQIVADCVSNLPQRCKEILTSFYYKNMSLDEILDARKENTSKAGLKTSKYKCMQNLKMLILTNFEKSNLKPYTHERGIIR